MYKKTQIKKANTFKQTRQTLTTLLMCVLSIIKKSAYSIYIYIYIYIHMSAN